MGIEFSKPAVIKVIMDAMIAENYDLKDIYDKVEAMEEPTQPEITEHQALSKIAERFPVGTDQLVKMLENTEALSKRQQFCDPHSCGSQIGIEELIDEKIKYWECQDEKSSCYHKEVGRFISNALSDMRLLKSSLPTQPELVEVPPCADVFLNKGNKELNLAYLISCKRNFLSCEMREGELKQWLRKTSLHDLLSLAIGYTVIKEQLYYVKVGNLVFAGWEDSFIAKFTKTDNIGWTDYAHKITTKDAAVEVARIVGGYTVLVDQEPKLPQEIEASEYLEEEE